MRLYVNDRLYSSCVPINEHLTRLSKKNNSVLYKLEEFLDKKLIADPSLSEIRDIILSVSGDIIRLENSIVCGDHDEEL
ncbi:hypothetical protein P9173_09280 [Bacillus safensis]|uniref:hypothetical protein n=1 Tax=Bacillus safensis TaxID=561879 RepID=UPI0022829091|nr:hypothetical protein [Bacillus safensis]MCY7542507.1 hypothetical protein [Bacillus safensis]MCY7552382.1 hypothetical protein [Bacillus safensis]MCY7644813.1 hypothetical protein [Bacillus safensis]MCY7655872.1 hypothetical protein [Bacillus safensis]MEC3710346.1 hypothetical protein [Bacillus safensis]